MENQATGKDSTTCALCAYSCEHSDDLKHHMKIQHSYKQCEVCENTTTDESKLKKHRETEHIGVMYRCGKCAFISAHPQYIRDHVIIHHALISFACRHCLYLGQGPTALRYKQFSI